MNVRNKNITFTQTIVIICSLSWNIHHQMKSKTDREMDLTKSSETRHLYLGDSSGSLLPSCDSSPSVTSDVSCNSHDASLLVNAIISDSF